MKRLPLLFLCILLILPAGVKSQYRIPAGTFNCGGSVRNGGHIVYDTSGQAGAAHLAGASNEIKLGFWYMADLSSAVDVAIPSFSAERIQDDVILKWSVSADLEIDGFNIYRSENNEEGFIRLNSEPWDGEEDPVFRDPSAIPGRSYRYYISILENGAETARSRTIMLTLDPMPLTLYQNYPNPFNPSTTIAFFLPKESEVELKVYDTSGREIITLADGTMGAGKHRAEWNGTNRAGAAVSSGIYYYRLSTGRERITRKLVLMR